MWCGCISVPGTDVKLGSSLIATLTFTTPLRVFHRSMSHTKSAGSSWRSIRSRNAIFGWIVVTTTGARSSLPSSSTTPTARPPRTRILSTFAFVRTSQPKASAALRIESLTAPMPPCWKPHEPRWPSPTSPIEWCSIT